MKKRQKSKWHKIVYKSSKSELRIKYLSRFNTCDRGKGERKEIKHKICKKKRK